MSSPRRPGPEIFLPFPAERDAIPAAKHWRSTWVLSSVQTLKQRGHFKRYEALLPKEHAEAILMSAAGVWLPMDVARVHYEACEALHLPQTEQIEMGLAVGERGQGTVLRTAVHLANRGGMTPWSIFTQMQRLWERGADGGAAAVYRLGPKEAMLETIGCDLFDVQYFQNAFGGVLLGIVRLFCLRAYMHDVTPRGTRGGCSLRFQWA